MSGLMQTNLKSLPLVYRGKVRECYAVGQDKLLMIASDRISAFDSILSVPIPNKGKVLTQITQFWFDKLTQGMPNQLTGIDPATVVAPDEVDQVTGRAMVVKRLTPILIECVARGYIIGGGWKDYQATGSVCGIKLPEGSKWPRSFRNRSLRPQPKPKSAPTTKTFPLKRSWKCTAATLRRKSATTRSTCTPVPPNTRPPAASSSRHEV